MKLRADTRDCGRRRRVRVMDVGLFAGIASAMVFFLASATAQADVLQVGADSREGTFEGFADNQFLFRAQSGGQLKEPRTTVRSMKLDKPLEVILLRSTGRKPDNVILIGYEGGKFMVKRADKETGIAAMNVRSIEVEAAPTPGGVARGEGDAPDVIPAIDISGVEARPNLTASQTSALNRYKTARKKYEAFVAESTDIVTQMDKTRGKKREELMNVLRRRKMEEQPINRDLEACNSALLSAFPELQTGVKSPAPRIRQNAADVPARDFSRVTEIFLKIPKLKENEVLLLDTGILERIANLSAAQSEALRRYKSAKGDYERLADDPASVPDQADREALKTAVREAHSALLLAFPNLRLVAEE